MKEPIQEKFLNMADLLKLFRSAQGITGGLYQMLNHGVSTGGLFLLVGMIYERTHSREISKYGGLAKALPICTRHHWWTLSDAQSRRKYWGIVSFSGNDL